MYVDPGLTVVARSVALINEQSAITATAMQSGEEDGASVNPRKQAFSYNLITEALTDILRAK